MDGDHVRNIMGDDLGHTVEERRTNAWRICRLCHYLDSQDIDVVCAILSVFHETQDWNRENNSRYFEVYIQVSMEDLIARDQKGLYSSAASGEVKNVVGFDIPFEPPPRSDLIVANGEPFVPPSQLADGIVAALDRTLA
jgi:adenylylsulfate kinase